MISYKGISEAVLIHALYHGTKPLGMGYLQHLDDVSVEFVQKELDTMYKRPAFGLPHMDQPNAEANGEIYLDYYHGHPLKVRLNTEKKEFQERLYDRDAGEGAAQRIVDRLRGSL